MAIVTAKELVCQDTYCCFMLHGLMFNGGFCAAGLAAQQATALFKIKGAIDPSNQLADWQAGGSNACSFSGVTCNDAQEVTEL